MVRHEMKEGNIKIAWGYDDGLLGYFLSVYDERLKWKGNSSEEVNSICEKVCSTGDGAYFDLNTYPFGGFGYKVSEKTMFAFMRRYGIDPTKVNHPTGGIEVNKGQDKKATSAPTAAIPHGVQRMNEEATTPEMRIDPNYIKHRETKLRDVLENTTPGQTRTICVKRFDRTIRNLAQEYDVSLMRGPMSNVLPTVSLDDFQKGKGAGITFYLSEEGCEVGFKECAHPDCCIPERGERHKRCNQCKKAIYCSRTCQVADWKHHKKTCIPSEQAEK
ncbi:hypothetical protein BX616_009748 [Lobosporangium transversale]|uniref:MYND-type domain-containing protein n=1 Tax=Lobosporangium transversale TaxID=64571 RepID=A0A1Y2GRW9_9FUNG|nr:hypothetical protein BCR41DRAFT_320810 [Lobosporangium transversale]KAF9913681.1 hypothetical protein BX616_009748 [Lobosporangium transversale]ORZ20909.1 hypothetical protein BCR41DRAFT_320810 [Lobosporangium transversale]|eukprot:XP_021882818.1 hypothetical protein BCR41DRAFT_320810 [Lobosporangium transversale]